MSIRITCINKADGNHENPYVAITTLGFINEAESNPVRKLVTRIALYDWLEKDTSNNAYVKDSSGNKADLITAVSPKGTKYVKTKADKVTSDNLLKLNECAL